jgi:hypothetical protein
LDWIGRARIGFLVCLRPGCPSRRVCPSRLIEDRFGPAGALNAHCFLQGSYRQDTAIYTINDVDIVALCKLWYPPTPGSGSTGWTRDQIFEAVAQAIRADSRYADKVRYGPTSMVIHVDLAIKVEVLPVVYKSGTSNLQAEPFVLFRPERRQWEDGYAREHQRLLSLKNSALLAGGNFKPMIKVLKHLRSHCLRAPPRTGLAQQSTRK